MTRGGGVLRLAVALTLEVDVTYRAVNLFRYYLGALALKRFTSPLSAEMILRVLDVFTGPVFGLSCQITGNHAFESG